MLITFVSIPILAAENQNIELQTTDTPYSLAADAGISYDNAHGVLVASENARFESDEIVIVADEISVFYEEHIVRAVGEQLSIQVGKKIYKGTSLDFNYQTLIGSITGVSSQVNDLSVSGKTINLNEVNELEIDEVELTPCVLPNPHYSIKAKKVMVYPEDRIVAKAVWFYFNGYKIFYLPAYTVKYNKTTGSFESVFFATSLGYNSKDGIYLALDYPYELTDRLEGNISGQLAQHGDKYFEMENTYRLNSKLSLINSYLYQDEEDDGEITKNDELSAGLHYSNDGFDFYSLYKRDYLIDKSIVGIDSRYKYQNFNFRYFNEFTESDLSNQIYSIKYNSNTPLQLLYKKGYNIDYLPYLSVSNLKYSYSGININSSIGAGKVANKGISSDKVRLDIRMDKKLTINENMGLNLYGQLENNYYIYDENGNSPSENYYNYYKIGFNTNVNSPINEKIYIGYRLGYSYTWETGEAYLLDDKNDIKEILNPAVGISYHISEYDSIKFNIEGSYEFNTEDLEDFNVKLKRQFDCYSYYIAYDVVDEAYEFGINF